MYKLTLYISLFSLILFFGFTPNVSCEEGISDFLSKLEKTHIKEGDFSVLLFEPEKILSQVENNTGKTVNKYSFVSNCFEYNVCFKAIFTDWTQVKADELMQYGKQQSAEEELKGCLKRFHTNFEKLLNQEIKLDYKIPIEYKGYPGNEVRFSFAVEEEKYIATARVYMIDHRSYKLITVFPDKYSKNVSTYKFFNSFAIHYLENIKGK